MYTVTFYSFKGGVGRTLALANVAFSLASAGKRVLLVDFDLEAPGIDTFTALRADRPSLGIVDFVTEYRKTGIAPDASEYLFQPAGLSRREDIWVMPTGKQDESYGGRLNAIDWQHLYQEQSGFLLFEDLKEQWARIVKPDYVLIDSRTGHTDVGGICTRQLPDAVTLLFFPNEQNLRGLRTVVQSIRAETQESDRRIDLLFVASNVPRLDDESGILRNTLSGFRKALSYGRLDSTIHHYDSMSLLEQEVFTKERPRTTLAQEYRQLTESLRSRNIEDREITIRDLRNWRMRIPPSSRIEIANVEDRFRSIRRVYSGDGEVLHALSQVQLRIGRPEEAGQLRKEAEQLGFIPDEGLVDRIRGYYSAGNSEDAQTVIKSSLNRIIDENMLLAKQVFLITAELDVDFLPELIRLLDGTAIDADGRVFLAQSIMTRRESLVSSEYLLRSGLVSRGVDLSVLDEDDIDRISETIRNELALCLIAQRRPAEAVEVLQRRAPESPPTLIGSFNLAMAQWVLTKRVPKELFASVIEVERGSPHFKPTANYDQCMSLANWAIGERVVAQDRLNRSRACLGSDSGAESEFSCWRYLRVTAQQFLRDLDAQERLFATSDGRPVIVDDHD